MGIFKAIGKYLSNLFARGNGLLWETWARLGSRHDKKRGKPQRIRDLSADEAAHYASRIYKTSGRNSMSARFAFYALRLDSHHPEALLCASEFLHLAVGAEVPRENLIYSAWIVERARSSVKRSGQTFPDLETAHLRLLWELKFAVPKKDASARPTDFTDPSQFHIDELTYRQTLNQEMQRLGAPDKAFEVLLTLIGMRAGVLMQATSLLKFKSSPHSNSDYVLTYNYYRWLRSELSTLNVRL
jgi:hypothetical protein